MRVGIFETTHFEGAYPVIKCFDNGINEITIFCYEASYRQFQHLFHGQMDKYCWVVKTEKDSKYEFIYRIYKESRSRKLELLYLNTISDNFIFYSWMISQLKGIRVLVTVHSINNFFWKLPRFSLRAVVRHIGKKSLIRRVKEFNVVAITLVDCLKTKLPPSRKIYTVPGAIYEEKNWELRPLRAENVIKIVVPGIVDKRRRDYGMLVKLAELAQAAKLPISIIMLGGVNPEFGPQVIDFIKNSPFAGNIKHYTGTVVEQPEFDKQMCEAHIVLLPTTIQTYILDGIYEEYGITQSTGTLFDIVKHAKPFMAPRKLRVDPFLQDSCLRYDTADEIIDILIALVESPESWTMLQHKARNGSLHYTIDAVRQRNRGLFGDT